MKSIRLAIAFLCLGMYTVRLQAAGSPMVTSFSPTRGPVGTFVTINGVNFAQPVTVTFGGGMRGALDFTPTQLTVVVPDGAQTGFLRVSTPNGDTSTATAFVVAAAQPPVINSGTAANATVGVAFSYQITASNNPTTFAATGLPAGLSLDTTSGIISGSPVDAGIFAVTISAMNPVGTGSATLTVTIGSATATPTPTPTPTDSPTPTPTDSPTPTATPTPTSTPIPTPTPTVTPVPIPNPTPSATPLPVPTVYVAALAPVAHWKSGQPGSFTFNLSVSQLVATTVHFTLKGSAVNGQDYANLRSKVQIKPGKLSATISVVPRGNLGGADSKKVKLVLEAGDGYEVGTQGPVIVKIKE